MAQPNSRQQPELRYRIVCYELEGDHQTVILDATAQGFIAVTGTIADTARCTAKEPTPDRSRSNAGSPV
jgi:hypothetical protein